MYDSFDNTYQVCRKWSMWVHDELFDVLGNDWNWFSFQNYVLRRSHCTITIMVTSSLEKSLFLDWLFHPIRDTAGQERFRFDYHSTIDDNTFFLSLQKSYSKLYTRFNRSRCCLRYHQYVVSRVLLLSSKIRWFTFQIPIHFNKHPNGLMMFEPNVVVMLSSCLVSRIFFPSMIDLSFHSWK